jgi:hypothetical protein
MLQDCKDRVQRDAISQFLGVRRDKGWHSLTSSVKSSIIPHFPNP